MKDYRIFDQWEFRCTARNRPLRFLETCSFGVNSQSSSTNMFRTPFEKWSQRCSLRNRPLRHLGEDQKTEMHKGTESKGASHGELVLQA